MKTLILILLLMLAAPCAAQNACGLTIENAPALFNLKLGMTQAEVRQIFGKNIKISVKKNGTRSFFQNFIKKPAPPILPGVRALYLRFFENRIYQIEMFFEETNRQQTLADFTRDLSAKLSLPYAFENVKGKNVLKCAGFTIVTEKVLNPKVELTDEAGLAAFEAEQKRIAEEAKKKKADV